MYRVVITGLGAVTPIGNDVSSFWKGLLAGKNGIDRISRFDVSQFKHQLAAEVKEFRPLDRLDKTTVRKTDLFVQYALWAAAEAMEDSGLEGAVAPEDLGVCFGSGIGGFETFCQEHQALMEKGPRLVTPLFIPKMISNIAAGNIAIRYKAHGPCLSVTTACASGSHSIGEAYRAIRHGYTKAVICGGSEATINPLALAGFGNAMALSEATDKNAASLPFDKRRSGFVMGEGAGALILEEYGHALKRGAPVYGEICGYGSTCDAHHVTAPNPCVSASAKAVSDALKEAFPAPGQETPEAAALQPEASRIYVNAHGTGTPMNDATETALLKAAFGPEAASRLHISSTKSMTGHMLGAAGAVEAIAALLALSQGVVPPTINLLEPDPACDLHYTPGVPEQTPLDLALSVSLGFGGHNACLAFRKA
ncbi:MAG: beta-ketoacyl-ACP synthase II [Bacillota bacterium]|nr:beta-ketoacyl-ACP synthase II [Bacillota bacterium]